MSPEIPPCMGPVGRSLQRFVDAQDPVFATVCAELAAGRKRTHWMWFVFPQLDGLGSSELARYYALGSGDDARAYWQHAVLGPRLKCCTAMALQHLDKTAAAVFGTPDDLKLRSCMTLFREVAPEEPTFAAVIDGFFGGRADALTLALLNRPPPRWV